MQLGYLNAPKKKNKKNGQGKSSKFNLTAVSPYSLRTTSSDIIHYSYLFFIDTNLGSTLRASAFTHVHLIAPQAEQNVQYYCSYQLQVGLNHKRNHWSKRALNPCLFAVCSWMKGNVRPLCPGSWWAVTRLEPTMVGWLGFLFIYFNIMVTVVDIILVLDYYYYLGIY